MKLEFITPDDLLRFKYEMLEEIKHLLEQKRKIERRWFKGSEVKEMLNISEKTLRKMIAKGLLSPKKVLGTLFFDYKDIERMLTK